MSLTPVLYHYGGSFYSQRARLSLAEKGVKYKSHVISDMHSAWYVKNVNPKGTVPALEHCGSFYTDSRDIIEYVDTLPSDQPTLCPKDDTDESIRVRYFRDLIESINIPALSYGSLFHRHITTDCMVPRFLSKKKIEEMLKTKKRNLDELKKNDPTVVEGLESVKGITDKMDIIFDEGRVLEVVNDADRILGEIEEELQKRKSEFGDKEYWLCGQTFTIADIYLSCLLHRLTFVGQAKRLFLSNRLLTSEYYKRVLARTTFQRECAYANNVLRSMAPMIFQQARPYLIAISVAAVGVYCFYRRDEVLTAVDRVYQKGAEMWKQFASSA